MGPNDPQGQWDGRASGAGQPPTAPTDHNQSQQREFLAPFHPSHPVNSVPSNADGKPILQPFAAPQPAPVRQPVSPYRPQAPAGVPPQPYGQLPPMPPRPVAHDTHYFHGGYLPQVTPPYVPPKRRSRVLPAVLTVLAVVLLLGGGAYAFIASQQADPDLVFQNSLANALTTKSFSQTITSDDGTMTLKADVADLKKVSYSGRAESKMMKIDLQNYHTPQNGYLKLNQYPSMFEDEATAAYKSKWIQIRKDGKTEKDYIDSIGLFSPFSAERVVGADYVIGNFSPSDRQALLDLMRQEKVYTYDVQKVTQEVVDGQTALKYEVKVNGAGLKKVGEKVSKLIGADEDPQGSLADLLGGESRDFSGTMYVATGSERLIRVETKQDDIVSKVTYSAFDATKLEPEPETATQWGDFMKATEDMIIGLVGAGTDTGPAGPDDERQTDISTLQSHIEAYYAQYGYYPTLANMNDAAWRAKELKGLEPDALKDPEGSESALVAAPKAKVYSYKVGIGSGLASCEALPDKCSEYLLTATLSDGKAYTKETF